jgi:hypothetical protein
VAPPAAFAAPVCAVRPAGVWRHAVVLASYLAITVALTNNLWRQLPQGRLTIGGTDQYLFEWYLWYGPHAVILIQACKF